MKKVVKNTPDGSRSTEKYDELPAGPSSHETAEPGGWPQWLKSRPAYKGQTPPPDAAPGCFPLLALWDFPLEFSSRRALHC